MSEHRLVTELARLFHLPGARGVELGIGDDCACVRVGEQRVVVSVDAQVEGVHFRRGWFEDEQLGARAFAAAVSDLAAMGATPLAAVSSLVLPAHEAEALGLAIARGQSEAAARYVCPVVGGNLSRGGELSISTTVLGLVSRAPLRRDGARPGDRIWLAGALGLARAGLLMAQRGIRPSNPAQHAAWHAFARPVALLEAGGRAVGVASSAIDVSDGLVQDAGQIARASGVALVLEREALRRQSVTPHLEQLAAELDCDAEELVLRGGEDYALLITADAEVPGFVAIGHVREGAGLHLDDVPLALAGFDHFAR